MSDTRTSNAPAVGAQTAPPEDRPTVRRVSAASWAVFAIFAINGFVFASWASRLPAIRDALGLTPVGYRTALLAITVPLVASLLLSPIAAPPNPKAPAAEPDQLNPAPSEVGAPPVEERR